MIENSGSEGKKHVDALFVWKLFQRISWQSVIFASEQKGGQAEKSCIFSTLYISPPTRGNVIQII